MLLTPIQPKIKALKITYFVSHCTSKYAMENEEKEKNMTIFIKYHGELLTTTRDDLFNMLLCQVTKG